MKPLINYIAESRAELAKVTWPTRRQAMRLVVALVIFSLVVGAFIGGLDYIFSTILQKLILKG